jgi:sporulation protein YlmC with PRC-barrel domain
MAAVLPTPANSMRAWVACWLFACSVIPPGVAWSQSPAVDHARAPAAQGDQPSPTPEPQRATETPAVVIDRVAAQTLLGMPVQSLKGEDLGRVVDVVVDRSGLLRAAIVDFGGFLGVGTRKIAVDWRVVHFPENGPMNKLVVDLQRDQLRNAPVFKEGEPLVVIGATGAAYPPDEAPAPSASAPKP